MEDSGKTPYARWYEKNKLVLAERRKAKYHSDPAHREKVLSASKAWRRERTASPKTAIPTIYSLSFQDAADALGIHHLTLREWKDKGYFPTPAKFGGAYRFTAQQIELLAKIKKFFDDNGSRQGAKMDEFQGLTGLILANW